MSIKIIVASHKKYKMPDSTMYLPLHVGAEGKVTADGRELNLGYKKDNTGENISSRNASFCELTGLYWAWKNLDDDHIGLCHYRRYFKGKGSGDKWDQILNEEEASKILERVPVILPKKRNYFIETNYSQYAHAHHGADLDMTREIILKKYPDYIKAYDSLMKQTKEHRFNMMIMRKDLLDKYCTWLFDILFELEAHLDISGYNENDKRVFGFVSERLLDVWIDTNGIEYRELPVINMESQHWFKKGTAFLKRKVLRGKK